MSEDLVEAITAAQKAQAEYDADIARTAHGSDWQLAERKRAAYERVDKEFKAMVSLHLDDLLREREMDRKRGADW